jgi:hypothetical protein
MRWKTALIESEPGAKKWIRPHSLGTDEFINGIPKCCLWLKGTLPGEMRALPAVAERVRKVKAYRLESRREATRKLASAPALFGEIRQPETTYILIPRHSSERRAFIPIGFITPDVIVGDSNLCISEATPYHFGILMSLMHMAWVRHVCGRLKSDYRYSNSLVYNNFPWPEPTDTQVETISAGRAQAVLNARAKFPEHIGDLLRSGSRCHPVLAKSHAVISNRGGQ